MSSYASQHHLVSWLRLLAVTVSTGCKYTWQQSTVLVPAAESYKCSTAECGEDFVSLIRTLADPNPAVTAAFTTSAAWRCLLHPCLPPVPQAAMISNGQDNSTIKSGKEHQNQLPETSHSRSCQLLHSRTKQRQQWQWQQRQQHHAIGQSQPRPLGLPGTAASQQQLPQKQQPSSSRRMSPWWV